MRAVPPAHRTGDRFPLGFPGTNFAAYCQRGIDVREVNGVTKKRTVSGEKGTGRVLEFSLLKKHEKLAPWAGSLGRGQERTGAISNAS